MTTAAALPTCLAEWGEAWIAATPVASRRLIVGLSGGLDSTVLLHALLAWARPRGVPLLAAHVDHGLAAQSARWAERCRQQCREWAVDCSVLSVAAAGLSLEPGPGLEARARAARYQLLAPLVAAGDALLLAHHADDQSETLLLRLLQGRGLIPMPAQRSFGAGTLQRPLLALPRDTLRDYAGRQGLRWLDDPSNADQNLDRNFLRHRVLPLLRERWGPVDRSLVRVGAASEQTQAVLAQLLEGQATLDLSVLRAAQAAAPAQAVILLRAWLRGQGEFAATDRALGSFLTQLDAPPDRAPALALGAGRLLRDGQRVRFERFRR